MSSTEASRRKLIGSPERERKERARKIAALAGLIVVTVAAVAYYVWATTLCGDCGAPVPLPPA